MSERQYLPEIALQLAIAATGSMLYNIPKQADGEHLWSLYGLFFAFSLFSYVLDGFFMKKPKPLTAVILFKTGQVCAGWAAGAVLGLAGSIASGIFIGFVLLLMSLAAFRSVTGSLNRNLLILSFDTLAALILIYALFIELGRGVLYAQIPGVTGIIAAFAGLIRLRADERIRGRGILAVFGITAAVFLLSFLIFKLVMDPLGAGFTGLFAAVGAFFRWLAQLFHRLMLFLSRFFSDEAVPDPVSDPGPGISGGNAEELQQAQLPLAVFLVIAGILLAAAIITAVILFRKHRFSGSGHKRAARYAKAAVAEKVSLREALKIWIGKIKRYIKIKLYFLKNSKSPAARFFRIVRAAKRAGKSIRTGETPQQFLLRYISGLKEDDRRIPALKELVEELNRQLYCGRDR